MRQPQISRSYSGTGPGALNSKKQPEERFRMMTRVLTGFATLALAIGAYDAFTTAHPGMGVLLTLGAIAAAVPTIMDRR